MEIRDGNRDENRDENRKQNKGLASDSKTKKWTFIYWVDSFYLLNISISKYYLVSIIYLIKNKWVLFKRMVLGVIFYLLKLGLVKLQFE